MQPPLTGEMMKWAHVIILIWVIEVKASIWKRSVEAINANISPR